MTRHLADVSSSSGKVVSALSSGLRLRLGDLAHCARRISWWLLHDGVSELFADVIGFARHRQWASLRQVVRVSYYGLRIDRCWTGWDTLGRMILWTRIGVCNANVARHHVQNLSYPIAVYFGGR